MVGGRLIDTLYTIDRGNVERNLSNRIAERVLTANLGCAVTGVRLLDVHAPADVHDAFRDVASAIEDRDREIHDAAGYAAEKAAATAGEVAEIGSLAQAERHRSTVSASADGESFADLAREHKRAPWLTSSRLYFEAMERMLGKPRKYIHSNNGRDGEIDVWIGAGETLPMFPSPPTKDSEKTESEFQLAPADKR